MTPLKRPSKEKDDEINILTEKITFCKLQSKEDSID